MKKLSILYDTDSAQTTDVQISKGQIYLNGRIITTDRKDLIIIDLDGSLYPEKLVLKGVKCVAATHKVR
jgi:hypothetical protein